MRTRYLVSTFDFSVAKVFALSTVAAADLTTTNKAFSPRHRPSPAETRR
jgi:hypothetical protein